MKVPHNLLILRFIFGHSLLPNVAHEIHKPLMFRLQPLIAAYGIGWQRPMDPVSLNKEIQRDFMRYACNKMLTAAFEMSTTAPFDMQVYLTT